ncbi:unnamed protein product [Spirodela intermedia]|uniref:Uncharacterized protein n=1 Tax=Spirodela intermedia TaxID=51605 RepID=A0A7I8J914_SPIIN|nr:unnamed protein product [Spirodela intermedia]CAA6666677.1 unnamed protein product [Spirodela intermedia]
MDGDDRRKGYGWAMIAGLNAALLLYRPNSNYDPPLSTFMIECSSFLFFFFFFQLLKYGLVIFFNVTMWGCYVNSLKALSSLQATVTNFAANFLSSGLAGYFLFEEPLSSKAPLVSVARRRPFIILGVIVLSKSTVERKASRD